MPALFTLALAGRVFELRALSPDKLFAWGVALQHHGDKLQRICANPGRRTAGDVEREIRESCVKILHRYDPKQFTRTALQRAGIIEMKDAVVRLRDMNRSAIERN